MRLPIRHLFLATLSASSVLLSGCLFENKTSQDVFTSSLTLSFGMENTKAIAREENIPVPNDLYFFDAQGVRQDRLVIFGCGATDSGQEPVVENATKCSLEALDGWSTTAPFSLPITGDLQQIDSSSFAAGVRLYSPDRALVYGQDYTVKATAFGHLQIVPLKVLAPQTTYTLVITRQLTDRQGLPIQPAEAYVRAKRAEGAKGDHIRATEYKAVVRYGVDVGTILYAAQFTTQSIGRELIDMASKAKDLSLTFDSATAKAYRVDGFLPGCFGQGECVSKLTGTVQLPNYLPDPKSITAENCKVDVAHRDEAEFWFALYGADANSTGFQYTRESCPGLFQTMDFNDTSTTELNVSMVLPLLPSSGELSLNPVMFAHGITSIKELGNGGMLVLDNFVQPKIASRAQITGADGYGVVAIDHVLHGSRSLDLDGDKVYDITASSAVKALMPAYKDADVKFFIKSDAWLTSRDNIRKVVADLLNFKAALANAIDASGRVRFQGDKTSIYGHSMGGIVSVPTVGIEQIINDQPFSGMVLASPSGGIAGILMNSLWLGQDEVPPSFKFLPEFRLRMAEELGITAPTEQATLDAVRAFAEQSKELFLNKVAEIEPRFMAESQYLIQTVIDTVDPLNYAAVLQQQPTLLFSVVGSRAVNPELVDYKGAGFTAADQVVPVRVELDGQTLFTRCKPNATRDAEGKLQREGVSNNLICANGTEKVPYYALDITEFPLTGAEALATALSLRDVREGSPRSYSRLMRGNHNIGVGALTDSVAEGSATLSLVTQATMEVADETVAFFSDAVGVVDQVKEDLLEPR